MLCNWEKRETKHFSLCTCVNSAGQPVSLAILRYLVYQALGLFAADASLVLEHLNIGVLAASKFSRIPRIPPPHSTKKSGGWIPFTMKCQTPTSSPLRFWSFLTRLWCQSPWAGHIWWPKAHFFRHFTRRSVEGWANAEMIHWFFDDFYAYCMPVVDQWYLYNVKKTRVRVPFSSVSMAGPSAALVRWRLLSGFST